MTKMTTLAYWLMAMEGEMKEEHAMEEQVADDKEEQVDNESLDSSSGSLSDEDRELIDEQLKGKGFRRLRPIAKDEESESEREEEERRLVGRKRELARLFEEDDKVESDDEDDLADFIEEDDGDGDGEVKKQFVTRQQPKAVKRDYANLFGSTDLDPFVMRQLIEVFGDGTDYLDLVDDEMPEPSLERKEGECEKETLVEVHDWPERSVYCEQLPSQLELEAEAWWLVGRVEGRLNFANFGREAPTQLHQQLVQLLRLMRIEGLEAPFIATHAKDQYDARIGLQELWLVWDEDTIYRQLLTERHLLQQEIQQVPTNEDLSWLLELIQAAPCSDTLSLCRDYWHRIKRFQTALKPSDFGLLSIKEWAMAQMQGNINTATASDSVATLTPAQQHVITNWIMHPAIQGLIRPRLEAQACISCQPATTPLPAEHELAGMQWIRDKPVAVMLASEAAEAEQWRRLELGRERGLLQITFSFGDQPAMAHELACAWLMVENTSSTVALSTLAPLILRVMQEQTIPSLTKQLEQRMRNHSLLSIATGCQYALQERLMTIPSFGDGEVMVAVSWQNELTMVRWEMALGGKFTLKGYSQPGEDPMEWLSEQPAPKLILVSGADYRLVGLKRDLESFDGWKRGKRQSAAKRVSSVQWASDETVKALLSTDRSLLMFPSVGVRVACLVLRRWLDPLLALGQLTPQQLGQHLALHPSQPLMPRADGMLSASLERAMVNVVNLVGVNPHHTEQAALLKYVCGLGTRSAQHLLSHLKDLKSRADLNSILGPIRARNAAAVIRLSGDPLDGTRIHPEHYPLARKMACDALEIDQSDSDNVRVQKAIATILENPAPLADLLLDDYGRELWRRTGRCKDLVLRDIRAELQAPFAELRIVVEGSAEAMEEGQVLTMLYGAIPYSGMPVLLQRTPNTPHAYQVHSAIGLLCPISWHPLPARFIRPPTRPKPQVRAVVLTVELGGVEVEWRPEGEDMVRPLKDPFYNSSKSQSNNQSQSKSMQAEQPKVSKLSHAIQAHPSYRNIGRHQAEELLRQAPVGEVIVRPSGSRGHGHWTLMWKVNGEMDGSMLQSFDLTLSEDGKSLLLEREAFEDVDEIIARHLEPMAAYLLDCIRCPKYFDPRSMDHADCVQRVETHLHSLHQQQPGRIVYSLWLSRSHPGNLCLSYLPGQHRCHHESIRVMPTGYLLRAKPFERLEMLINWFKENWNSQHHRELRERAGELRDNRSEVRDAREGRDARDLRDNRDSRDTRSDLRDTRSYR